MKKQIIVNCDKCKELIAMSDEMEEVEASRLKTRLLINPIGAPKCDVCKIEPYSDINLMHTIEVVDFEPERKLPITPKSNE